jgi:uncharacterized protein YceK
MIKILLAAEGVTDYGKNRYDKRRGEYVRNDGPLQVLIRRCLDADSVEFKVASRKDIKDVSLLSCKRRLSDIDAQKEKLARLAVMEGCACVAYHMDEDNKGFNERYAHVQAVLEVSREKGLRCMAIVPMHMLESWLMCDDDAFPCKPSRPCLPKHPETAWGAKQDTESDYPKHCLHRVLGQFDRAPSAEEFAELASKISLDILKRKCPVSFGKFCEDIKELASEKD